MPTNAAKAAMNLPSTRSHSEKGINFLSLSFHFESFSKGLIDSRDLAFFILTTALFLFLNTRVLLFRKWR
ncbi:hypothetical protein FACS189485_23500 [Spirochaetia bacterium]|nr:hypothetical protein FACS189485_23500 [Spirochaetia bacterium]